ncbi:MAG: trehalose-phosphatase [Dehalococcoidia bacterium]|nr:trehalose-phosphatase [Dehalococcoidia bacterium]
MEYLFNDWNSIWKQLKAAKHRVILFDYDGTLTPIVDRPEIAYLPDEIRVMLGKLAHRPGVTVGIISGRAISDIREMVGVDNIIFAGNHGLEIEGPGIRFIHPLTDEIKSAMHVIGLVLTKAMARIRGVIVEDKGLTLSVHYRMVDTEHLQQVDDIFDNTVNIVRKVGKIRTSSGKKVHEVRPAVPWNKGKAVQMIMEKFLPKNVRASYLSMYVGDVLTDEDAFEAINSAGGISIFVGDGRQKSAAAYYLNDTSEVSSLLAEVLKIT